MPISATSPPSAASATFPVSWAAPSAPRASRDAASAGWSTASPVEGVLRAPSRRRRSGRPVPEDERERLEERCEPSARAGAELPQETILVCHELGEDGIDDAPARCRERDAGRTS